MDGEPDSNYAARIAVLNGPILEEFTALTKMNQRQLKPNRVIRSLES
jgi:hypothetical protein